MNELSPYETIRLATANDVPELARLLTLLGFPVTMEELAPRWLKWAATGDIALVAASAEGGLAGAVTLHRMQVLHRAKSVGRITALIVDSAVRGQGVGRALVAAAEQELLAAGCGLLEITSNYQLVSAHTFYQHLGYERTSTRLAKTLRQAAD